MSDVARFRFGRCVCGHEARSHKRNYAAGAYAYLWCRIAPCSCMRYRTSADWAPRNPKARPRRSRS